MNPQSGKGRAHHEDDHGVHAAPMQVEFSVVQAVTDSRREVNSKAMWDIFTGEYLDRATPLEQISVTVDGPQTEGSETKVTAEIEWQGEHKTIQGRGNGPLAAYAQALEALGVDFEVQEYSQHARTAGDDAEAAAYTLAEVNGQKVWGVGIASSITYASRKAMTSAVNRAYTNEASVLAGGV